MDTIKKLRILYANGEVDKVIQQMTVFAEELEDDDLYNEILSQSSQYKSLEKE